jgi:hypothetical protein
MYDDESKRVLRQVLETTKENNKILKKVRRSQTYGSLLRLIFWAIVLGLPIYLYFTILKPIISELGMSLGDIGENIKSFQDAISQGVSKAGDLVDFSGGEEVISE